MALFGGLACVARVVGTVGFGLCSLGMVAVSMTATAAVEAVVAKVTEIIENKLEECAQAGNHGNEEEDETKYVSK